MWLRFPGVACVVLMLSGCDPVEVVSNSGQGAYEVSLAAIDSGFAVAWYDDRDGNPEIYFRLLHRSGKPAGPEIRLTTDSLFSYEADIQPAGPDFVVAWYERTPEGELHARVGRWDRQGSVKWTKVLSPSGQSGRNTLVRVHGSELFTAWIQDRGEVAELWGQWWTLEGDPLTEPRHLAPASRTTWNLNARVDEEGDAWLVFDAKSGTRANELFRLRVGKTETSLTRLTEDDGFASKYPDLALHGNLAALTWFDERDGNQEVYLFTGGASDLKEGMEGRSRRITTTSGESIGAYVAVNPQSYGVAWCDNTPGQHEIYFQSFTFSGVPRGGIRRVTNTPTESLIPSIVPTADGFAIAWNEYLPRGAGHAPGGKSQVAFAIMR